MTGKPRPVDGVLTLLHVLLPGAALIVEGDDARGPARQAGDDETDPRIQLARMPFGLGDNLPRRFPGHGLVAEACIIVALHVVRWSADGRLSRWAMQSWRTLLADRRMAHLKPSASGNLYTSGEAEMALAT